MDLVSLYIPAYNVSRYLAKAIEAALAQTHPFDEILVIDDHSRDNSAEIASRYPGIRLIQHPVNKGVSAARNTAFHAARNELVASLDADVVAEPTWLATLLPYFADPKVAAAGGFNNEGVKTSLADRWRGARMAQDWGDQRRPPFLYGSNTVHRRSAVLEIGGYNEWLRAGEDPDISRRLRARGWDLVYDPGAHATHIRHDTLKSVLGMYWTWWRWGNQAYRNGVTLRSWLGHVLFVHFRYNFLVPAKADLSRGRLDLFAIDLLVLGYMPYRDFRLWMSMKSPRAPQGS
jgi:cellulose synthase/poly-beta-1,6-N-acetylglucosamine synthase-like glycosyltransferase